MCRLEYITKHINALLKHLENKKQKITITITIRTSICTSRANFDVSAKALAIPILFLLDLLKHLQQQKFIASLNF